MSASSSSFSLDGLEQEVQKVLTDAKVFDIGSYGWLNEDDADPDYIGHAMWQTDQPLLDFSVAFGDVPVRRRPEELEKQVMTLGEDFCGLMELSRLSIGLTLLWKQQATQSFLNESTFFRLHHTDAYLKLAIASDRLRDLLIVACTGSAPENYKITTSRRKYVTPFKEAGDLLTLRGIDTSRLTEPLAALPAEASTIFSFIDRRNFIVHSIATRMAKFMRESVNELQHRYDHQQAHGFQPRTLDFADLKRQTESIEEDCRREVSDSVQELISWYQFLINTSNHVFQVEHWSRYLSGRNGTEA